MSPDDRLIEQMVQVTASIETALNKYPEAIDLDLHRDRARAALAVVQAEYRQRIEALRLTDVPDDAYGPRGFNAALDAVLEAIGEPDARP